MTRTDANADALRLRLMADGVQPAQNLAARLGVSQPTISRQLAALGSRIERIGRGTATRFALRRPVEVSQSNLFEFEGRRFLEVTRFDRIGATGRRGVLSLGAIVDANSFELSGAAWGDVAVEMSRAGLLSEVDARALRQIWCFGQCIANNDMHRGNCSFLPNDDGPFGVAPVYDMLPMAYAPTRQGTIPAEVARPPVAVPRHQEDWDRAMAAARVFWGVVREDPMISEGFRRMAAAVFSTLESRF